MLSRRCLVGSSDFVKGLLIRNTKNEYMSKNTECFIMVNLLFLIFVFVPLLVKSLYIYGLNISIIDPLMDCDYWILPDGYLFDVNHT